MMQAGTMLMQSFLQGLIGNPQQQAQRQAEEEARQAAWRAQLERIRAEEERRKEAMKTRLLAMLKGVGPAPQLQFKVDALGNSPVREGVSSPGLQFKFGDPTSSASLVDIPASSAMAQLTRAAYYSEQAAAAASPEEAWALADAAFNATLGVQVNLPVPPTTRPLPIQDADMSQIQSVRTQYQDASNRLQASAAKIAEIEQRRELAEQVAAEARARQAEAERARRQEELERARRVAAEAQALLEAVNSQLAALQAETRNSAQAVDASAGAALDLLDALRKRYGAGRKPEQRPEMDAYLRGIQDASSCRSQNGGLYCQGAGPACVENYHNGYRVGETAKEEKLREAYALGQQASLTKNRLVPLNHPEAGGPCFYVWRNVFSSGFNGTPFTMIGR